MADVFVSFARDDQTAATAVIDAIERSGLSVFRDLPAGGSSLAAIETARCVVVLWSQAAVRSDFVQQEIAHAIRAWSEGRLLLATLDVTALPVGLRDLQGVPVSIAPNGLDASNLLAEIKTIVGQSSPPAAHEGEAPPPALRKQGSFLPFAATLAALSGIGIAAICIVVWPGPREPLQRPTPPSSVVPMPPPPVAAPSRSPIWDRSEASGGGPGGIAPPGGVTRPLPPAPLPEATPDGRGRGSGRGGRVRGTVPPDEQPPSAPTPERSSPPVAGPVPSPLDRAPPAGGFSDGIGSAHPFGIAFFLAMLALGIAIGAGSVWAWLKYSQRRAIRVPAAADGPIVARAAVPDAVHQVFVSYSRQDGRAVEALVSHIEKAGYTVWIDRHSTGSQRYAAPIVRAIKTSQIVALMCSQHAFTSDHVIREVYVAGDYKKPFIAFQLDYSEFPDDVQYFVSGFPRVSIESLDVAQLRSEIARLVAARPQGTA